MARYELVREIENNCARNQMRDVFFTEVETSDPVETVREFLKNEAQLELTLTEEDEESCTVLANCSGVLQRFLFTKI